MDDYSSHLAVVPSHLDKLTSALAKGDLEQARLFATDIRDRLDAVINWIYAAEAKGQGDG